MTKSRNTRIAEDLFKVRLSHKSLLEKVGINVPFTNLDRYYSDKLKSFDVLKDFRKKGNLDTPTLIVSLFTMVLIIFSLYMIVSAISSSGSFNTAGGTASSLIGNTQTMLTRLGNTGFMFAAMGLILFSVIGSFLLVTHPIFLLLDVFLLPIMVIISSALSNGYEASLYTLAAASNFQVINFFFLNLPIIIIAVDILTALAAYALIKHG